MYDRIITNNSDNGSRSIVLLQKKFKRFGKKTRPTMGGELPRQPPP